MPMKSLRLAFALSGLLAITGVAQAESQWDATHQRHDEVNNRQARQNERISEERREHQLAAQRAHEMQRHDQGDYHESHETGR
jgi:hypothetical protein